MNTNYNFKYFPIFPDGVRLAKMPCVGCAKDECLEGVYFNSSPAIDCVCVHDLVSGLQTVFIPSYLRKRLEDVVRAEHSDWLPSQQKEYLNEAVNTLSRTPPVPWIQNNNWPVCHANFCAYIGEWNQERLMQESQASDGREYLLSIIEQRDGIADVDALWLDIGNEWTAIFVFECLICKRRIAIDQSY